ncbi:hypothetical protein LTR10_018405 [Elasticomyces elasticus]|uniref:EthD domain-containing protein n=1 Tax=Exophiala sideris TaxID=1016849 RepID=A0ABR0J7B7_9EURO|nr:hypothetical protein LTR10_018405 [Elasticomyces elasticus]KAK5029538.1 hypothetical protein LTS07_006000 [Exophiala sideris]KAK5036768.1 hypothetical protein LTR13_005148 [Exophiala sideris]KAK5058167.1 hypothetical protein LTR69_007164 [Exophiala sideris]KAK5182127.1 hypothetical protein LTR44_005728 [Eurotiomycetes sp. CCFEE 6388]
MPTKYLLSVNSRPQPGVGVDDDLWIKWYKEEHLDDLVNSKTATKAVFYKESHDFAFKAKEPHPRGFLALYQTDREEPLKSKEFQHDVRQNSEMWPQQKPTSEIGDFDGRNYTLIQEFDPKKVGDSAPPYLLTVEMEPSEANEKDFEDWYRQEHLDLLSKLPGYRRSLRYVIGPKAFNTQGEPPKYLAIHEIDDVHAFDGKEAEAANTTPWTTKHLKEAKTFIPRMWEKVYSKGF